MADGVRIDVQGTGRGIDRLQEVRASGLTAMHKPCDTVALHALLTRMALAGHPGPFESSDC